MVGYSVGDFDVLEYWAEGPDEYGLMLSVTRGDVGVQIGPPGAEPDWAVEGSNAVERWSQRAFSCLTEFGVPADVAASLLADVYAFSVSDFVDG